MNSTPISLDEARLASLALQAQIRALEAATVYGEPLELESMSAWCCSMELQLRAIEQAINAHLLRGGA